MKDAKQTVLVTGVSGNLGQRLLPLLTGYNVVGIDMAEPPAQYPMRFEKIDLGNEAATARLVSLLRETNVCAVVHLAFVIDPVRTGVLDVDRMWQINVAGTVRIVEAIAEVNRKGGGVRKFIFPSSVSAYGPRLDRPAVESSPLRAHTLPYAVHKRESDEVVQCRANSMGACSTYILRPHIYAGATMQNYLVGSLRGTPTGRGKLGVRFRKKGVRLPLAIPFDRRYMDNLFQFVHVDDVARLIAFILAGADGSGALTLLNVAGRGDPLTFRSCAEIAKSKIIRVPGEITCRLLLKIFWALGISGIPPDALPYMLGSYVMDTTSLRTFLGVEYTNVIRYTVEDALRDCFVEPGKVRLQGASAAESQVLPRAV